MKILIFTLLQILDFLTTVYFLGMGIAEGNPIINHLFQCLKDPINSLLLVKVAGVLFLLNSRADKCLFKANIFFALLIVWNLTAIAIG